MGRWISRDPIEEEGGFNLYTFVKNNSLSLIDMLGREVATGVGEKFKGYDSFIEYMDVIIATNTIINDFLAGFSGSYSFDQSHPYTKGLAKHPHMDNVREFLENHITKFCSGKVSDTTGMMSFDTDDHLSGLDIIKWFLGDAFSYITMGLIGHDRAIVFGSYYLRWTLSIIDCSKPCTITASINFKAWDTIGAKSGFSIPGSGKRGNRVSLPANPLGTHQPFSDVKIEWHWAEEISVKR